MRKKLCLAKIPVKEWVKTVELWLSIKIKFSIHVKHNYYTNMHSYCFLNSKLSIFKTCIQSYYHFKLTQHNLGYCFHTHNFTRKLISTCRIKLFYLSNFLVLKVNLLSSVCLELLQILGHQCFTCVLQYIHRENILTGFYL